MLKIHEWRYIQKNGDSMISIQKNIHEKTVYEVGGERISTVMQLINENDQRNYVVKPDEHVQKANLNTCRWINDEIRS